MEIGLIYSRKDPVQTEARDFLRQYVREHGILARIEEFDKPVKSPTLVINGEAIRDMRAKPREKNPPMYPAVDDMARAIEMHLWRV
jgi:hypothetical protein